MSKIIIDGNGAVFGRICSFAAKRALEGNEIIVVNSEKTIMTGNKKDIIAKYSAIRKKGGHSQKGPKLSNVPHMILKRAIRGMLPDHRKGQGKETLKRIILPFYLPVLTLIASLIIIKSKDDYNFFKYKLGLFIFGIITIIISEISIRYSSSSILENAYLVSLPMLLFFFVYVYFKIKLKKPVMIN